MDDAKRVEDPADPRRCQANTSKGQCTLISVPNGKNCRIHGGVMQERNHQKTMKRKYDLAKWQARMSEFADEDDSKNLSEEVAILRMTLEQVVRQINTPLDFMLYSAKIGDLVSRIEKVVVSCNRLEAASGQLLDKSAALNLAAQMVTIIAKYVNDPVAVDAVSNEIIQAIVKTENTE